MFCNKDKGKVSSGNFYFNFFFQILFSLARVAQLSVTTLLYSGALDTFNTFFQLVLGEWQGGVGERISTEKQWEAGTSDSVSHFEVCTQYVLAAHKTTGGNQGETSNPCLFQGSRGQVVSFHTGNIPVESYRSDTVCAMYMIPFFKCWLFGNIIMSLQNFKV